MRSVVSCTHVHAYIWTVGAISWFCLTRAIAGIRDTRIPTVSLPYSRYVIQYIIAYRKFLGEAEGPLARPRARARCTYCKAGVLEHSRPKVIKSAASRGSQRGRNAAV